MVSNQVAM